MVGGWAEVGDLTTVLLGTFHRRCIFTVPHYLEAKDFKVDSKLDEVAYRRAVGYATVAGGGFEDEERYFERMAGFVTLFTAFLQVPIRKPPIHILPMVSDCVCWAAGHPYGVGEGWRWLARVCNMAPKPATAAVCHAFLSTAGYEMHRVYGAQMTKLMTRVGAAECWGKMPETAGARKASKVRLQQLLCEFDRDKQFAEPDGHTLANSTEHSSGIVTINPGDAHAE